jgi:D-ribulokinase
MKYFLGVDVGTYSIRVGLFKETGELIDSKVETIHVYNFETDFYEQSSDEIWHAICKSIAFLCEKHANIRCDIVTVGFDATCSLVVLDEKFAPISVNPVRHETNANNVIMWMDHRAKDQAEFINSLKCECLSTVGGKISPEMDPPKILWLKQNFKECFDRAEHFFSLPDYLVWRATGVDVRSVCTTTCKW